MKVVDHELESWFVLADENEYYVDIRCSIRNCPFWLLIKLNMEEVISYQSDERHFICDFTKKVQNFPQAYFQRNQPIDVQQIVGSVVALWRARFAFRT